MMEVNQYTCNKCDYSVDHPIDTCPVCGAVFYWLVRASRDLDQAEKDQFQAEMDRLMEGRISAEYMFHGGKIWLPHAFWHYHPTGDPLKLFSWIQDLQLVQYKKSAGKSIVSEGQKAKKTTGYDTNPGEKRTSLAVTASAREPIQVERKPPAGRIGTHRVFLQRINVFFRALVGPVSLALFLILMACAYFFICMGYQKNQKDRNHAWLEKRATGSVEKILTEEDSQK